MGEILYEWNELGEATSHLSDGLERGELGGDARTMIGHATRIAGIPID